MNAAALSKVQEVCQIHLDSNRLRPIAEEAVENAGKVTSCKSEIQALQSKITVLTSRKLLVSFIERVELTEEKESIIKFRLHKLKAI